MRKFLKPKKITNVPPVAVFRLLFSILGSDLDVVDSLREFRDYRCPTD